MCGIGIDITESVTYLKMAQIESLVSVGLCITNSSTVFKDGPCTVSNKMSGYHLANA